MVVGSISSVFLVVALLTTMKSLTVMYPMWNTTRTEMIVNLVMQMQLVEGGCLRRHELFEGDESRTRSIEVLTCDGESMPFKPFKELGSKKSIVNIDLVVVRQGRDVYNALDVFDLNICKSCF